jgi:hypothetical protein
MSLLRGRAGLPLIVTGGRPQRRDVLIGRTLSHPGSHNLRHDRLGFGNGSPSQELRCSSKYPRTNLQYWPNASRG